MNYSVPNTLQIAFKIALGAAIAWSICQFLSFSDTAFMASLMVVSTTLMGLGMGWGFFTHGLLALIVVISGATLILILFGKTYITFFIVVLFAELLWSYFQTHGFRSNLSVLMVMNAVEIINGNNRDPVTFSFNLLVSIIVGISVAIFLNRLFWTKMIKQELEQQLEQILQNSSQLTQVLFEGYLQGDFSSSTAQALRIKILKGVQDSQKQLQVGTLDPTGQQLGEVDWMAIINIEQQISLHLSAIFRLVNASEEVNFLKELELDLTHLSNSITTAFLSLAELSVKNDSRNHLSDLNVHFFYIKEQVKQQRITESITKIPLSERLRFYSIVHRLEKLINEINNLGRYTESKKQKDCR